MRLNTGPPWLIGTAFLAVLPVRLCAQTLQALGSAKDTTQYVEVFAEGNLRNVVSQPTDVSSASGSLGMRYRGPTYIASGLINIAGTSDTVSSSLGATLLAPSAGKALNAGLLDIRRRFVPWLGNDCEQKNNRMKVRCHFGIHLYASIASWRWATSTDSTGAALTAQDVPVWGSGLGFFYTFFEGRIGDRPAQDNQSVAMVLDAGLATRHLRGDLYDQDSLRLSLLGDTDRNFEGLELGLNLQFPELRAGITYYFINGDVPGFSHGQVVAGVSVQANLTGGPLQTDPPPVSQGSPPPKQPSDTSSHQPADTTAAPQ
jgi:hypothetical protein